MRIFTKMTLAVAGVLILSGMANAQTPSDAQMMKKFEACVAVSYDHGSFDQYWEGKLLRKNETIATINRNAINPMIAIGILDELNFYIVLPYIKTESSEPNGGDLHGSKGFQDLSFALKYRILKKTTGPGTLSLFASGGVGTPASNYLSDYRPYSIGNGTTEWSLRAMAQYKLEPSIYARIMGGHLFRGQTQIERDFYYNNGAYYSTWMDVPSAWEYQAVIGSWLLDNTLKLEANYYVLKSTSGDDIRAYNAAQPTNKVNFSQVGFMVQYFIKPVKGLGVFANYSQMLEGRNMGKFTNFGGGLTYQFNYWKKPTSTPEAK